MQVNETALGLRMIAAAVISATVTASAVILIGRVWTGPAPVETVQPVTQAAVVGTATATLIPVDLQR